MDLNHPNPYQAPRAISVPKGHARFRLRRWFAALLYFVLLLDLLVVWKFGVQPFWVSIPTFMLLLVVSVFTRHRARIRLDERGIAYRDLVQFVDMSWDRVVRVTHKPGKTSILTDSALAQITVSRRHEDYEAIVGRLVELQPVLDFGVFDENKVQESYRS